LAFDLEKFGQQNFEILQHSLFWWKKAIELRRTALLL
jgi:hypothetical protein